MTKRQHNRSGLIVFGLLAVLLLGTISTTVLLANLNLLLMRLGYEPVKVVPIERALRSYELKGNRLPRPKVVISRRLIAPAIQPGSLHLDCPQVSEATVRSTAPEWLRQL